MGSLAQKRKPIANSLSPKRAQQGLLPLVAHLLGLGLVVAVETDPEVPGWEELVVLVETPLDVEEAARRLEAFETTWWLDHLPQAHGKLFFTLEFV